MKLKNAKIYRFTNSLHLQFILEILAIITKFDYIKLKIIDLFNMLGICTGKEESCYKIVRKSDLSRMKEEMDKARDTVIIGVKHMIKAGIRHFDKDIREASQRLKIVFDTYDKPIPIIHLQYDAETATINNLLQELNNKYAADMQKIGITSWMTELQAKNNEFDHLVKSYLGEESEKSPFHLADMRKETDKVYHDIVAYINALVLIDKETSYDQFITEMNTLIKHYNDVFAQHQGRLNSTIENEIKTDKR